MTKAVAQSHRILCQTARGDAGTAAAPPLAGHTRAVGHRPRRPACAASSVASTAARWPPPPVASPQQPS